MSREEEIREAWTLLVAKIRKQQAQRERVAREMWEPLRKAVQQAMKATQDDFALAPPQPTDPRDRALWAKEHRNTGPAKDQYEHRGQR